MSNLHPAVVHTHTVCLHDGYTAIDVDDQTRKIISLAMYQTINGVMPWNIQRERQTHLSRLFESAKPEIFVNRFVIECQHTHGNTTYLPVTASHELALCGVNTDHITLAHLTIDMMHSTREHPGMKASQTLLLTLAQDDTRG